MTKQYVCPRCGYVTHLKFDFRKHINRKIICPAVNTDVSLDHLKKTIDEKSNVKKMKCDLCEKEFISNKGWKNHECKKDKVSELITRIDKLEKEMETKCISQNITNNIQNITNNIQINNNNNNSNYNLRAFGEEDKSFLTDKVIGDLFFMNLNFKELIETLHFNSEMPENNNIRIKSSKRNLLEIFRGDKWDIVTFVNGLNEVLQNGNKIFQDYYRNNKDSVKDEMTKEELEILVDKMYKIDLLNKEVVKPLYSELIAMLENYRIVPMIKQ